MKQINNKSHFIKIKYIYDALNLYTDDVHLFYGMNPLSFWSESVSKPGKKIMFAGKYLVNISNHFYYKSCIMGNLSKFKSLKKNLKFILISSL